MSSSSTERQRFLSADRGSVVRLVVVVVLGAAALFGPVVGSTSARFSDVKQFGVTFAVPPGPTESPTPAPTPGPVPSPTP